MFSWFISLLLLFGYNGKAAQWLPWELAAAEITASHLLTNPQPGPRLTRAGHAQWFGANWRSVSWDSGMT